MEITREELSELISNAVAAVLEKKPYAGPVKTTDNRMTRTEVAEYLGVGPETITRYVKEGRLKANVITRKYYFSFSDIEKMIKSN